ncbi:MAG: DUF3990 domain-containing protein [Peptococcaceae bacterium]|nr:DUF3990 domain-containing protein [Peptococcaceae bacterium]MBQ2995016.1 DUF3990 domain-containing protein [Peptococcaceae bacterium]
MEFSKILYHGSPDIIVQPQLGKGKVYNDYGQGFYCTEHMELAKEWACDEKRSGYANKYKLNMRGLCVLNLSDPQYSILHWLTMLMTYRKIRVSASVMKLGIDWLQAHYTIDLAPYDVIVGYRADDSYFSFARSFVNNEISLEQLSYAMRLGKLGEQYVLKTQKAFDALEFLAYIPADYREYYIKRKQRDEQARKAYFTELEQYDMLNGIYMRDLIRGEVEVHDTRLR